MAVAATESDGHLPVAYTFENVESLVQRLYLPGSPQEIARIQNGLQAIQKSPEGWALADALLQSQDAKVRFFGALTFTIKINTDWASLGANSTAVLERLLSWLIRLVTMNEGPLVVRKLCSALVAYFFQKTTSWTHCIRHVLCCFHADLVVPEANIEHSQIHSNAVQQLSIHQITTTLWLATTLVEEAGKISFDSIQTHEYQEKVSENLDDIAQVLQVLLHLGVGDNATLMQEAVRCLQSWIMYAQRAWSSNEQTLKPLKALMPRVIGHLEEPALFDASQELLTDIMANYPTFLNTDDYQSLARILCGQLAETNNTKLRCGDFDEQPMAYARLLLAYGDASVQDIAQHTDDPYYSYIMDQLLGLLMCEGYAVVEDDICSQALEFWGTYVEHLVDCLFGAEEERPSWMDRAVKYVMKAVEASWHKIRVPPSDVIAISWDHDARAGFKAFRTDVEDLISCTYTLLGIGLFDHFVQLALDALSSQAWYHLEATLFCLNALADAIGSDDTGDKSLLKLFSSDIFSKITESTTMIPSQTQQTALNLIKWYTGFFERHTAYLPQTLSFLFTCLKVPDLAIIASRAIFSLCYSCRKVLTADLGAFLQQYETLLSWHAVDPLIKEKVVGGVAAIIQALSPEENKLAPLARLLFFVRKDVEGCVLILSSGAIEEAQTKGLNSLRCLVSIGKSMQVPDGTPIDLEVEDTGWNIWEQEQGRSIQNDIILCYEAILSRLRSDGEVVEAACQIFRAGYTESVPGPFVFPPTCTVDLVVNCDRNTARLGYVLETAGLMLRKHKANPSEETKAAAFKCFYHALYLLDTINNDPTNDPDIATSCIDLAEKLIPSYLEILFDPRLRSTIHSFFIFTLQCLTATEIMPKRSSASFWSCFLQTQEQSPAVQEVVVAAIHECGPQLAHALMKGIGGGAARSEIETLSEPLKKMIYNQPRAKQWLADALASDTFPSTLVGDLEKRIWLQQVMNLRGARGTNKAVLDFWMTCRGTNLSFTS